MNLRHAVDGVLTRPADHRPNPQALDRISGLSAALRLRSADNRDPAALASAAGPRALASARSGWQDDQAYFGDHLDAGGHGTRKVVVALLVTVLAFTGCSYKQKSPGQYEAPAASPSSGY